AVEGMVWSGPSKPAIGYSEFLDRVQNDQVERVVITDTQIYGVMKPPNAPAAPAAKPSPGAVPTPLAVAGKQTPWRLDLSAWWHRLMATQERYRAATARRQA